MTLLPKPSFEASQHSQQLIDLISNKIQSQLGWISFFDFMQLALYAPNLGYYAAGLQKFGAGGDFVTAPEMSPIFAQTLANQVAEILQLNAGDVLELGAGTGKLAAELLKALAEKQALPKQYCILEVSASLQKVQWDYLQKNLAKEVFQRVIWLSELPASFDGVVIGNEVLDAIPVHILHKTNDAIYVRGLAMQGEALVWQDRLLENAHEPEIFAQAQALNLANNYTTELCFAAAGLIKSLAQMLQSGVILLIDYGFSAAEYYHPQRTEGTLMCHYQQYAHSDPLTNIGLQDITAHVNFSQIAQTAFDHGLEIAGYTNQAQFLMSCGILDLMQQIPATDIAQYAPMASAVQKLLSPAEMGELFKVMALTKNINAELIGFIHGDKTHTL